ncbi:MAG: formylaminopyrimidine deformylase [Thermomicrobiales bacterium]|nr:formylaminopyrimidine deformylase [Thermomicrobiales bacterium]
MDLTAQVRARIIGAVDELEADLVALTRDLVGCKTDSQSVDNPLFASEAVRCQDIVARQLEAIGMEVERWEEPPRYPVTAGVLRSRGAGKSLAINGHVDVVPVGDTSAWEHDPWGGEVVDGKLWGRGATDMKGGVAAGIMAVRALRAAGVVPAGDVWVHVVTDEEVVGMSTRRLVQRLPKVDAVIVAEPTDLKIMPVEGGLVHFRIEVEGRESHAGNRYMSVHAGGLGDRAGINAIEKALKIVTALQELERQWGNLRHHPMLPPGFNTILPGVIVGGPGGGDDGQLNLISNPGTSPNYCSVEYNLWFLPGETFEGVRDEIEGYVADVCRTDPWLREHPPRFTWKLRNIFFPAAETAPDHPFIQGLSGALTELGLPPRVEAFTAASELAWYAEQGMSGTIFGPGRIAQAHSPNEYVEVEQLVGACKAMALAIAGWCVASVSL